MQAAYRSWGIKLTFIVCCATFISAAVKAQQPAQFTLYRNNLAALNPSYVGSDGLLNASVLVRQQWSGLLGAPQTQFISVDLPVNVISSGLGLTLENDRLGLQQTVQGAVAYSFFFRTGKRGRLSAGIRAGFGAISWNGSQIRTPDGLYGVGMIDHKDAFLPIVPFEGRFPVVDLGVMYQRNFVKLGIALKNVVQSSQNHTINNGIIRLETNYLFTFATEFETGEDLRLIPSAFFKTDLTENQLDITLVSEFLQKFKAGVGFRGWSRTTKDALNIIAGLRISEGVSLLYAHDLNLSPLKNSNSGSHELLLQCKLNTSIGKAMPERVIYNGRYF